MKCCNQCFKRICRCSNRQDIEIDYFIYPAIYEFNRKGYRTAGCCSGHSDNDKLTTYIEFKTDAGFDFSSDYIQFDSYKYNGVHTKRNLLTVIPNVSKRYSLKRTDKSRIIIDINKDLYRIAQTVPACRNSKCSPINFFDNYFEEKADVQIIDDVQKPWMLMIPKTGGCKNDVNNFFDVAGDGECLYSFIVNSSGDLNRKIVGNRYTPGDSIKEIVSFDAGAVPQMMQFGQDEGMAIEKASINGTIWNLSYIKLYRLDDYGKFVTGYGVLEDISDWIEEQPDRDIIDAFTNGFSKLADKGVYICAFSSRNTIIIFSNGIDFAYFCSKAGTSVVFGPIDYAESEFKHVSVPNKECFVFADGMLLLRKRINNYADTY